MIRRHPDIKYLRRLNDVEPMAERQLRMLRALWPLLKPGGMLLYATCSLLHAENGAVAIRFLDEHRDARAIHPLQTWVPETVRLMPRVGYQCLPGPAGLDGFYYALMSKESG